MTGSEIIVQAASQKDMHTIESLAKELDLDCEDFDWTLFIVAKKGDKIVGFGRLRKYPMNDVLKQEECIEIATVGVIAQEQKTGVGSSIVKELIQLSPFTVFVVCVIPGFFEKLGFKPVKQYPLVLQKKVDFCKSYDFCEEQVFVMQLIK